MLAHHPTCSAFRDHMVVVRRRNRAGVPVCAGCLTFWPALLAGVVLWNIALARGHVAWDLLLLAGLALGAVQGLSYARLVRSRAAKLVTKGLVGLGAAAVLVALYGAPWPVAGRIGAVLGLAIPAAALHGLRLRAIKAACTACPWRRGWDACPGFAPFNGHRPGLRPPEAADDAPLPHAWPWPRDASGRHPQASSG